MNDSTTTPQTRPAIAESLRNFDSLPDCAHVRLPVVCALFGVAPATVWRRVKSGQIPAPTKNGPRVSAFQVGKLRAALASATA